MEKLTASQIVEADGALTDILRDHTIVDVNHDLGRACQT